MDYKLQYLCTLGAHAEYESAMSQIALSRSRSNPDSTQTTLWGGFEDRIGLVLLYLGQYVIHTYWSLHAHVLLYLSKRLPLETNAYFLERQRDKSSGERVKQSIHSLLLKLAQ